MYLNFKNYTPECHNFFREVRGVFYIGISLSQMDKICWLCTWSKDLARRVFSTDLFYYFNASWIFLRKYVVLNLVLAVLPAIVTTRRFFPLFKQSEVNPPAISYSSNDYLFLVLRVSNAKTQARKICLPLSCLIIKCTLFQINARGFDH